MASLPAICPYTWPTCSERIDLRRKNTLSHGLHHQNLLLKNLASLVGVTDLYRAEIEPPQKEVLQAGAT